MLDLARGKRIIARLEESNPEAILWGTKDSDLDLYTQALIGIAERCGQPPVAVYDYKLMVEALAADFKKTRALAGMFDFGCPPDESDPYESAVEWLDFNVVGAWLGEHTPVTLYCDDEDGPG